MLPVRSNVRTTLRSANINRGAELRREQARTSQLSHLISVTLGMGSQWELTEATDALLVPWSFVVEGLQQTEWLTIDLVCLAVNDVDAK